MGLARSRRTLDEGLRVRVNLTQDSQLHVVDGERGNTSWSTVTSTVATLPGHGGCGVRGVIGVDERTDPVWD